MLYILVVNSEDQAEHGNGNSTATKVLYILFITYSNLYNDLFFYFVRCKTQPFKGL